MRTEAICYSVDNFKKYMRRDELQMKTKRIITMIIAATLLVSAAAGCSDLSDSDTKKSITGSSQSEKSDSKDEKEQSSEGKEEGKDEKKEDTKGELPTIKEQVCFEKEGVKVTAVKLDSEMIGGDYIQLLVENNSKKDYTVGCTALIVNNCMISDLFVSDVAAGKKSNEKMYLLSSDLEAGGIENIGQIEIYFHMYEKDDYSNEIKIDPVVIKTSDFDKMDAKPDDSGHELYNKDGIRIIGKYVDENSFWGKSVLLYVENKSGKIARISCDDISVNGFMVSGLFSSTVYNNKYAIDSIDLLSSDLEDNNIKSIDDIEVKFNIMFDEDYMNTITTDPIKFSAKS